MARIQDCNLHQIVTFFEFVGVTLTFRTIFKRNNSLFVFGHNAVFMQDNFVALFNYFVVVDFSDEPVRPFGLFAIVTHRRFDVRAQAEAFVDQIALKVHTLTRSTSKLRAATNSGAIGPIGPGSPIATRQVSAISHLTSENSIISRHLTGALVWQNKPLCWVLHIAGR